MFQVSDESMAWYKDSDSDSLYRLGIGGVNGVRANASLKALYFTI